MRHLSTRRRLLTAAAAAVLPIVAVASASPAHAQDGPVSDPAGAAASWLAAQSAGDYFEFNGAPDISSTLDSLIGLMAARVGGDQVQTTLEWLNEPDTLNSYVFPGGGEDEDAAIAVGPAGKVMFVVATAGGDPADFGGVELAEEVAAAPPEGIDAGALAWATLGLARTEDGISEDITSALLAAQCDDGGFRFDAPEGGACVGDPDTTGLVTSALAVIGDDAAEAHAGALQWLQDNQGPEGGFDGGFGENANSTAMAAQALLTEPDAAEAAEASISFLIGLQIGCGNDAEGAIRFSDPEDPEFGEASRLLATAQSLVPLSGQNLAQLDASDSAADVPAVECETATDGEDEGEDQATAADGEDESDSDSANWLPWLIIGAVIVLAAIIAYLVVRARRGNPTESGEGKDGE